MSSISWPAYFAAERTTFQRDMRTIIKILQTPDDNNERLDFCHQIANRSSFPGSMTNLLDAVKTAESTKEHLAQRHLTANIKCLTNMFIDNPKEGRSKCFRSRLITILGYCRRLCEQLRDIRDPWRAERVADALDLVVLQVGRLTLDGDVVGDREALKAEKVAKEKERVFKRQSKRKESAELEELRLVWNALQFQGLGKGGCSCKPCVELESKVKSSRK
ncbi:uncharacterized protein N7496_002968 [Penicillium cataractarum]|uniref:Uncharacterized protein n=1 Tax=Penicillium cataractarum TaxID=2100454 RepID=A0A9W9SLE5_9EURO|nr:uncharacterized protein N7496_002968 [Penicillium cataractarum]KAJ5380540.1 hypothetical protein N7496_002968 [Penicillium cataractarum]